MTSPSSRPRRQKHEHQHISADVTFGVYLFIDGIRWPASHINFNSVEEAEEIARAFARVLNAKSIVPAEFIVLSSRGEEVGRYT